MKYINWGKMSGRTLLLGVAVLFGWIVYGMPILANEQSGTISQEGGSLSNSFYNLSVGKYGEISSLKIANDDYDLNLFAVYTPVGVNIVA